MRVIFFCHGSRGDFYIFSCMLLCFFLSPLSEGRRDGDVCGTPFAAVFTLAEVEQQVAVSFKVGGAGLYLHARLCIVLFVGFDIV